MHEVLLLHDDDDEIHISCCTNVCTNTLSNDLTSSSEEDVRVTAAILGFVRWIFDICPLMLNMLYVLDEWMEGRSKADVRKK